MPQACRITKPGPSVCHTYLVAKHRENGTANGRVRHTLGERWYILKRAVITFVMGAGLDNGAKLTFFTLLAFAPSILAIYSVATVTLANNSELVTQVSTDFIGSYIPEEYQELARNIVSMVVGTRTQGVVNLIVAVAVSLFSASGYVRAFARTANGAYGVWEGRNPVRLWGAMVVVTAVEVVGVVIVLAALMVNETIVDALVVPLAEPLGLEGVVDFLTRQFLPIWAWLRWPVIAAMVMLLLDVLYYFTPNLRTSRFRWLSAGSIAATLGVVLVGGIFFTYLSYFTGLSPYGALGTVLAAMFALWAVNIFIVLGLLIDVETERMTQLRRGRAAESEFQSPLRSTEGVEFQERVRDRLVEQARRIRTGPEPETDTEV